MIIKITTLFPLVLFSTEFVCRVDTSINININKSLSLNDDEDYLSDYMKQGDLIIKKKKYKKRISEISM